MRKHIIRIFVSSTFEDMTIERDILRDRVFPEITEECKKEGWVLEYVDLRWGISKEAGESNNTMQICLEELRRCQNLSPKPNFLILYGEHSGWHPTPELLSEKAFDILRLMAINKSEKSILQQCYERDTNSIPTRYLLKSKDQDGVILKLLKRASRVCPRLPEIQRLHASATMQEIYAGALDVEDSKNHVVTYVRTFSDSKEVELGKYRDVDSEVWKSNLEKLKSKLDEKTFINVNLDFVQYQSHAYDDAIYNALYKRLKEIVEREIRSCAQKDETDIALDENEEYMTSIASQVVGRKSTIDALLQEISVNPTVLLTGESGTGKTSLMAKLSSLLKARGNKVAYVFIGSTPNITKGEYMARLIVAQLPEYDIPNNNYSPADLFQILSQASPKEPTYILIDSLDSLQKGDFFRQMAWLPGKLHANIHIVCSLIATHEISHYPYASQYNLPKLSVEEGLDILLADLEAKNRRITPEQQKVVEHLLELGDNTPLYAKLVSYIVARLHSDDNLTIESTGNRLTTKDLWQYIIHILTTKNFHDERLVRLYLQALSLTYYGVSDDELGCFLANDDQYYDRLQKDSFHNLEQNGKRSVPPIIISRLKYDLDALLTTSRVEDKLVYRWRHKLMGEMTTDYLLELLEYKQYDRDRALQALRRPLHEVYMQQMHEGNVHAIYELQHLQTYSDEYFNLFTDLAYVCKRISNGLTSKLGYIYHNIRFDDDERNYNWEEIRNLELEASRCYKQGIEAFDYLLKFAFQYSPSSYIGRTVRSRYASQVSMWRENLLCRGDSADEAMKPIFKPIVHPCAICDDGCTAYGVKDGKIWQLDLIKNTASELRFNNLGYVISMKCTGDNARYWAVLSDKRFVMIYDRHANKVLNIVQLTDYIMDKTQADEFRGTKPQTRDGDAYYLSYCEPIRLALQYQNGAIEVWEGKEQVLSLESTGTNRGRLACISGNGKYCYMYLWNQEQFEKIDQKDTNYNRETKHCITRYDIDALHAETYPMTIDFYHDLHNIASSEDGNAFLYSEGRYTVYMGTSGSKGVVAHNHRLDLNHCAYAISPDGKKAYSFGETDGAIVAYDTHDMIPKYLLMGTLANMYNAIFSHSTRFAYIFANSFYEHHSQDIPQWYILDTDKETHSLSSLIRSGVYSMDVWDNHLIFSVGGDCVTDCDSTVYHMDINTRKITTLDVPAEVNRSYPAQNISFSRDGHTILFTREDMVYVFQDFKYVTCHKVDTTVDEKMLNKDGILLEMDYYVRHGNIYSTNDVYHSIFKQYNVPIAEFAYLDHHPLYEKLPVVPLGNVAGGIPEVSYYVRKIRNGILIYPNDKNPGFAYYFHGEYEKAH